MGRRQKPPLLDSFSADATEDADGFSDSLEVPVRRTFIEYGCTSESPSLATAWKSARTAPAAIGISIRRAFDFWKEDMTITRGRPDLTYVGGPLGSDLLDTAPPAELAPKVECFRKECIQVSHPRQAQPSVLYRLTPTSAKAAGYWSADAYHRNEAEHITASPSAREHRIAAADYHPDISAYSSEASDSEAEFTCIPCIEYSESATPPSIGSVGHGAGTCKRCCFFPKGRCSNAENCDFCHFSHEKRKTKSKKKSKKRRRGKRGGEGACNPVPPGPQIVNYDCGDQKLVWFPPLVNTATLMPAFVRN